MVIGGRCQVMMRFFMGINFNIRNFMKTEKKSYFEQIYFFLTEIILVFKEFIRY